MSITAHVYQIHVAADVDTVWAAITQSEWTRDHFHGTTYAEGPVPGARQEMTPPADPGLAELRARAPASRS